jgi:uncharacterized membrane protein YeaQ/YmgE (transglycosylase-associated protein family)
MALVLTLILGGLTGWLANILVKTHVPMGILASVPVGVVGAFLGFAIAGGLGLQPNSVVSWTIVVLTAVLSAAWLVGTLRATMGLFFEEGAWR